MKTLYTFQKEGAFVREKIFCFVPACYARGGGGITFSARADELIPIDSAHFPDENFRAYVLDIDPNKDGYLSPSEIVRRTYINVDSREIASISGIEFFTELQDLFCTSNNLTEIDISKNKNLRSVHFSENQVKYIDLKGHTNLRTLECNKNLIENLDLHEVPNLQYLYCGENKLTELNISVIPNLIVLGCYYNNLKELDISNNRNIQEISCQGNKLKELNLQNNTQLEKLYCFQNQLTALNLENNTKLETLWCFQNEIAVLDVSNCKSLTELQADDSTQIIRERAIEIITPSLKSANYGKKYSLLLRAKGTAPINWIVDGLPDGLDIDDETGRISGIPEETGTFNINVIAYNEAGSVSKSMTLTVKGIPPALSGTLPSGTIDQYYFYSLKLSRGTEPITWSISGTLPDGLSFDKESGIIYGMPNEVWNDRVTITAANDRGKKSKTVRFRIQGQAPKILTVSLEDGTVGKDYSMELEVSGSPQMILTAKNLPEGLTLNGNIIEGIPTKAGIKKVKITASNPLKKVTKSFTLNISSAKTWDVDALPEKISVPEISPLTFGNAPEYFTIAELPVISVDESGMYDFEIELSKDIYAGKKLFWFANSEEPCEDDDIAEFYNGDGEEISCVPDDKKISVSAWLNKGKVYAPIIAIQQ